MEFRNLSAKVSTNTCCPNPIFILHLADLSFQARLAVNDESSRATQKRLPRGNSACTENKLFAEDRTAHMYDHTFIAILCVEVLVLIEDLILKYIVHIPAPHSNFDRTSYCFDKLAIIFRV